MSVRVRRWASRFGYGVPTAVSPLDRPPARLDLAQGGVCCWARLLDDGPDLLRGQPGTLKDESLGAVGLHVSPTGASG